MFLMCLICSLIYQYLMARRPDYLA
jgi:hypothetical protein